jgi:hypothetical protein
LSLYPYYNIFLTKSQDLFLVLLRLRPDAVTACLILAGPVLRLDDDAFSPFVILAATALGLHEGYGRFFLSLPERPQGFPVFTSTHSSLNHFLRAAPFLLFLTATFLTPVFSAYLTALSYSTRRIRRRPHFVTGFDLLCTRIVSFFLFLRHYFFFFFFFFLGGLPT